MSYDINLLDPISKEIIEINDAHFLRGGTYKMGGSKELTLNITYNYSEILRQVIQPEDTPSEYKTGIRSLYGMTALETIPILEAAISNLKDNVVNNYWQPTEGNVKRALNNLLTMCKMRPDAIVDGD